MNDAFGAAHRAHASTEGIVHHVKQAAAGLADGGRNSSTSARCSSIPERPFVAILGGAKVSDKIEVIENLLREVDALLIGGAMAYTFFKARGLPVGKSLVEDDKLDAARDIERAREGARRAARAAGRSRRRAEARGRRADRDARRSATRRSAIAWASTSARRRSQRYRDVIAGAKTVVWNGPMGVFEIDAVRARHDRRRAGGRRREGHDDHRRRRLDRRGRRRPASPIGSRTSRPAAARRSSSSAAARCPASPR